MLLPQNVAGKNDVVVKNTISPATAGNPVTFSSSLAPSTLPSVMEPVNEPVAPLSRTTRRAYACETPFDGSRSLPVPWNRYCCVDPTVTDAIDPNIGCAAPASYSFVGDVATILGEPAFKVMSKRQIRPSRSLTYALVM